MYKYYKTTQSQIEYTKTNGFTTLWMIYNLVRYDGEVNKSRLVYLVHFFKGEYVYHMRWMGEHRPLYNDLIYIHKNWHDFKGNVVFQSIYEYINDKMLYTVSESDCRSQYDVIRAYYLSSDCKGYFCLNELLRDIIDKTVDEKAAIQELKYWTENLEKAIGITPIQN